MKVGYVYLDDKYVGTLTQNDDNSFIFEYTDDWYLNHKNEPVSLTMPVTKQRYEGNILFPFFDGLIPEGYLLEVALNKYNIERNDRMSLLLKTASNPIGNVSVYERRKNE